MIARNLRHGGILKIGASISFVLIATVPGIPSLSVEGRGPKAPVAPPQAAAQPKLLKFEDFSYEGAFRLPREDSNGDRFGFGGKPMAFNPAGPSLFSATHAGRIAEVDIPTVVNSADVTRLPFAKYLQGFHDPTEGRLKEVSAGGGAGLSGLVVQGNRLYGTASVYYDANNDQQLSHYSRSLRLDVPSFQGWSQVWENGRTGYVAGFMALIPQEWQTRLGGSALTGQCCIPIVSRTSLGPAGFAMDLAQVGRSKIDATPLVYYDGAHATLGAWDGSNEYYGIATVMGGVAIIGGSRTALYIGRNGMGPACYGTGTPNKALHHTPVGDGSQYCFDPTDGSRGTHAYPYRYQMWAYDLEDLAAARERKRSPWDVKPYAIWPFDFPIAEQGVSIGGVAYDASSNRIYLAQMWADVDGSAYRPLVHAFRIR